MTEPENPLETSAVAGSNALRELQQQMQSLRTLLNGALMALLLLSAGVCIYLYRQDNIVEKELAAARAIERDYEENKQPLLNAFVSKLHEYAKTHPDFNPILDKYGIRAPPAAPVAGQQPSPTPPATIPAKGAK